MKNRLLLGQKLTLGFGGMILILLFSTAFSIHSLISTVRQKDYIINHYQRILLDTKDLRVAVERLSGSARAYFLTKDDKFLERIEEHSKTSQRILHELSERVKEKKLELEEIKEAAQAYKNAAAGMIEFLKTNKIIDAPTIAQQFEETVYPVFTDLRDAIQAFSEAEEALVLDAKKASTETANRTIRIIIIIAAAGFLIAALLSYIFARLLLRQVNRSVQIADQIAAGARDIVFPPSSGDEFGRLLEALRSMLSGIVQSEKALLESNRLQTGANELSGRLQGELPSEKIAEHALIYLARRFDAQVGAFYLLQESGGLVRLASYASSPGDARFPEGFQPGESLVGQAAKGHEILLVEDVPEHYSMIRSASGAAKPVQLILIPILHEGKTSAVIELGSFKKFSREQQDFLKHVNESIGISLDSSLSRKKLKLLLEETQAQSEELQSQQEELKIANEELQQKTEEMESQQEELQQMNEELEQQRSHLEEQRDGLDQLNRELQATNRYKSEFLANMSHELRTPLNSLLILSKLLMENRDRTLTERQLEFARTIHSSGNDLLNLISDILDLSKIEAGKFELRAEEFSLKELVEAIDRGIRPLAQEKKLDFSVAVEEGLPAVLCTDRQRLAQILKNLLSNAVKFTEKGKIALRFFRPHSSAGSIAFSVSDTGIGIEDEKRHLIFESFRQADMTVSRKYGGTGLGLSITRELVRLLGGRIDVASEVGKGSVFTVVLPARLSEEAPPQEKPRKLVKASEVKIPRDDEYPFAFGIEDDRHRLEPGSLSLLIIEDDPAYAQILMDLARQKKYHCLLANDGETGLALARRYRPSAILLDFRLPGTDGLLVLKSIKDDLEIRHIPVHMMSVVDHSQEARQLGALGYLVKGSDPAVLGLLFDKLKENLAKNVKRLLIIEDNNVQRESIRHLVGDDRTESVAVATGREALAALAGHSFDCVILDLNLPDMPGIELLEKIHASKAEHVPPIIVYTGKVLSEAEENLLRKYSKSIIIKGARSPERLLDEVTLFLHRVTSELPLEQRQILKHLRKKDEGLRGKKVLLVDDDMRNVFALTSVLESLGIVVQIAKNGKQAVDFVRTNETQLVLMDVMMPEMDGFEATRLIRSEDRFKKLPIIAVTAKAMKGDRDKALEAGANDYLSKPVDIDRLISLLRVWLSG